ATSTSQSEQAEKMFMLGKAMRHRREYLDLCDIEKPLELKTIEKTVLKNFDSICLQLNKPELKSQRQPNLLATIPKLSQLLRDIWNRGEELGDDLSGNNYWRTMLRTLTDQSCDLSCLVREHAKEIEKPGTQASQQYFQWSLSLFCIQLELEAMFPNRRYSTYKIECSAAAADWWKRHFGRSDLVTWHDFQFALSKRFNIKSLAEAYDLKQEVNITGSDHVSAYEFDVFARLFAPWGDQTIDLWRTIVKDHPAFVRLRFREVKSLLRGQRPYSYLFRRSTNTPSVWSIGYINDAGAVTQILVKPDKTIVEALTECTELGFLLFPAGKDTCFAPSLEAFRQVSVEDLQLKKQQKRQSKLQKQQDKQPDEIYVVAPELQCSLCSQRSDEVTSMESCEHILCDICFDRFVQPKLYDLGSSRGSLKLFCPVCLGVNDAASPVKEVDLICLDDEFQAPVVAPNAEGAASLAWLEYPLADFDPILTPVKLTGESKREAERPEVEALYDKPVKPSKKPSGETPRSDIEALYDKPVKPSKKPSGQTPRSDIEALYDKPVKPSKKPSGEAPQKEQESAAKDAYSLLSNSSSKLPAAAEPQQQNQPGGYLFYGSEEEVRRLLSLVPGLKFVRLQDLPKGCEMLPQQCSSNSVDGLYSQIWDGKSG
ncbi:hypothetical protein BOX15_Mlig011770g1, partial [Macrostomum lignano]